MIVSIFFFFSCTCSCLNNITTTGPESTAEILNLSEKRISLFYIFSFLSSLTDGGVPKSLGVCWTPLPAKAQGSFYHTCSGQIRTWPVPLRSSVRRGPCISSLQEYSCLSSGCFWQMENLIAKSFVWRGEKRGWEEVRHILHLAEIL